MKKIYRPCDECIHEKNCTLLRGCWQWKKWFTAYWAGLRRKVLE